MSCLLCYDDFGEDVDESKEFPGYCTECAKTDEVKKETLNLMGSKSSCIFDATKKCVIYTEPYSTCGPFFHMFQEDAVSCGYFSINNFIGYDKFDRTRAREMFNKIYENKELLLLLKKLVNEYINSKYISVLTKNAIHEQLFYRFTKHTIDSMFINPDVGLPYMINIASIDLIEDTKGYSIIFKGMQLAKMSDLLSIDTDKIMIGDSFSGYAHAKCARKTTASCRIPNKWFIIDSQSTKQEPLDPTSAEFNKHSALSTESTPIAYYSGFTRDAYVYKLPPKSI